MIFVLLSSRVGLAGKESNAADLALADGCRTRFPQVTYYNYLPLTVAQIQLHNASLFCKSLQLYCCFEPHIFVQLVSSTQFPKVGDCAHRPGVTGQVLLLCTAFLCLSDRLMLLLYPVTLSLCLLLKLNDDDDDVEKNLRG